MNHFNKIHLLKKQIRILYAGEIQISQNILLMEKNVIADELKTFLIETERKNQRIIKKLKEISDCLQIHTNSESDEVIKNICFEIGCVINNQKGNKVMIQSVITIFFHTLASYQVDEYRTTMLYTAEEVNFDITQLLWECLQDKKRIKETIKKLEETILKNKGRENIFIPERVYAYPQRLSLLSFSPHSR